MNDVEILTLLDQFERSEAALLTWGFVDAGFTEDEVKDQARGFLSLDDLQAEQAVEDLVARRLLFRTRTGRKVLYRTRSAEVVRLLARLRQLFPPHLLDGSWRQAPTLVSDFRYSLRPRTYPDRTIDPADAAERIGSGRDDGVKKAIAALLNRGTGFRLAEFQLQATQRILDDLKGRTSRGTVIGAGTGSGKTLAFYLPALAHLVTRLGPDSWTKVLAVYPRNELLKDQFSETYTEARRLDGVLAESGGRKVTIGAFFGLTPRSGEALLTRDTWHRLAGGFVCPYLRCPRCGGDLIWMEADVRADRESLICARSNCRATIPEGEVILTRAHMRQTPPDILFTTTEMLNRQLSDATNGHVFGIGPRAPRKPELMLLDEVHTYDGTAGAQAAYVIRRWRRAVARPVQFVGLSATLREAQTFFAELVGLPDHDVSSIAPIESDMITDGMEYLLALRGDPASGTSLLSTTIQASMLLRRALDLDASASGGVSGSRLFVFTDDLDVTNRLYFDLLSAEGRDSWGRPDPSAHGPLAALRASTGPDHAERLILGQSWDLCEAIGHRLDAAGALRIGRTSSQDPGVTTGSDVIVATASLDVGFNDPTVGAVLQHKAPRDPAQFLQRKGRAGRLRGMRPWTVVVLSDYGRDRLAYQGYDLLFDPFLEPRTLPLRNTYVLRIQAAFALMDWLGSRLPHHLRGSVWLDLAGPPALNQPGSAHAAERQRLELTLIESVLTNESTRADMMSFVQQALQLTDEQTEVVTWEAPRSLLLDVLPTLRRRLQSGWSSEGIPGADYQVRWQPMPDFVPASLFSDLNLPETRIRLPRAQRGAEESDTQSPVLQALRTFAPGRVSRRFGVEHRYVRHWIPVPLDQQTVTLDLATFLDGSDLGTFTFGSPETRESFRCIRPWSIRPQRPPPQLLDSTNAMLEWRSRVDPHDSGDDAAIPSPSPWDTLARSLTIFVHARRSGVHFTRLAIASHAALAFEHGRRANVDATFTLDGQPAALGFTLDVDAIKLNASIPSFFTHGSAYQMDSRSVGSFRTSYFAHLVETDAALLAVANLFQLQWLSHLYMALIVERALLDHVPLEEAQTLLQAESLGPQLRHVLDVMFLSLPISPESELSPDPDAAASADANDSAPPRQRLHQALSDLASDPIVFTRLATHAGVLWGSPDERWQAWAAKRFATTLGAAVLEATNRMCRDVGAQNLVLDTDLDQHGGTCDIWLSEPSIGGGGIVEEFVHRYTDDPRRFFRLVESALGPSDFEVVDGELGRALDLAGSDPEIKQRLLDIRSAESQAAIMSAVRDLLTILAARGVAVSHPVVAGLNARILRPGSSSRTDALLRGLIHQWQDEEARLGVEIDARIFAYLASASDDVDRAVTPPPGALGDARQHRFATIYGLLWPRGSAVRAASLRPANPYHSLPPTDRLLVLSALHTTTAVVMLDDPSWRENLALALIGSGTAVLSASPTDTRNLRRAVIEIQSIPIEAGYLMLYPRVIGFARDGGRLRVSLELREAFQ